MSVLHSFFNSSAAYRVRIALNLKGVEWVHRGVDIRRGDQDSAEYRALNPAGLVPTFADEAVRISQSLAVIDYLDRRYPEPLLVPRDGRDRECVLQIAMTIACDIHPVNNLRVLRYLTGPLGLTEAQKVQWVHHWLGTGFSTIETMLPDHDGWCVGDGPTLADCCLVPQVANARRAAFDMTPFPRVTRIVAFCEAHPGFAAAAPAAQPDHIDH